MRRLLGATALGFVVLMVMAMFGLGIVALFAAGATLGSVYVVWPFLFQRSSPSRLSPEDLRRVHELANDNSPSSDT